MSSQVHVGGKLIEGVSGYSMQENSTPLDAADSTGAVGGMTVTFDKRVDVDDVKRMRRKVLALDDLGQGQLIGRVDSTSGSDGVSTITGQNRLTLLAVNRTCQPFTGTLLDAIAYYLGLCGITDPNDYFVDENIATWPVTLIGTYGNVWIQLKKLCVVADIEISVVSDKIVVRPVRQRIAQNYRDASRSWGIDDSQIALSVQVYYYQPTVVHPGDATLRATSAIDWGASSVDTVDGGGGAIVKGRAVGVVDTSGGDTGGGGGGGGFEVA